MRILITGIAGLLGGRLAHWLQQHTQHEIIGVDDYSGGLAANVPEDLAAMFALTLGEPGGGLGPIMRAWQPELVYHFAAMPAECLSPFVRMANYRANLLATAEVVNECINHSVKRLVFTSSIAVYGPGNPPFDESHPTHPVDPYGIAKLACELDIKVAGSQHGLDWVILRPHNVFGPGQVYTQQFRNVISLWMDRYRKGLPAVIFGDGSQRRAFTFCEDILPSLYLAGTQEEASRRTINIGGARDISILGLAEMMRGMLPGFAVEFTEQRHEVRSAHSSNDLAAELLKFEERTPLEIGLEIMWQWLREQPLVLPSPTPHLEVTEGLYAAWR